MSIIEASPGREVLAPLAGRWAASPLLDAIPSALLRHPPAIGEAIANLRGDHDGQPVPLPTPDERSLKAAAVLVPLVVRDESVSVLLTQRAAHLNRHAGQIAFPGGRVDPDDASIVAAALREASEEIGLDARYVQPLGFLDPYLSSTGYRIVPVVARIQSDVPLTLNADEVVATFEVPLAFLMDPANHARHQREWQGAIRHYYAISFAERYIWGVTAGIIRNFYERLLRA